ncbi:tyrosine-type recombinase/integrase [Halobacillus karajensis]|uniref:tyrosine-type recombinase/integrase n=1 Tax=Halobacillus karajensis TaxID=195088 RepID=UPI00045CEBD4|nr:tyrosine-type recombinase/integrase [Halobacillus karajensis]CDQ21692.1 Tyrosine recombinase XerC [Halobacillus karajensis]
MKELINTYLEEMLETKSESTVKGHRSTLNRFARFVDVDEPVEIITKDVVRFRNEMYEEKKTGTVNTMLKRIKLFLSWCVDQGILEDSPAQEVKLLTASEEVPKWLTEQQEDLLIKKVRKKYQGSEAKKISYREEAIIRLMLQAGLRVQEVVNIKLDDIDAFGEKAKLLVRGKNNQQRIVPLIKEVYQIIQKYLKHHGTKGEYLFYSQKSDRITVKRIQDIVKEFQGVSRGNIVINELHPHMLRHTFAHNLANRGMALESIARVLGHTKKDGTPNIQQTIRYTKASDDELASNMEDILATK